MAPNYTVHAHVVDVRSDAPKGSDRLLIDTNVWYWQTYTKCSLGNNAAFANQLSTYPGYLSRALAADAQLYHCGVSLGELSLLIESTERDICAAGGLPIKAKDFRHSGARASVVREIETAWTQVTSMSQLAAVALDDATLADVVKRMGVAATDAYDALLLNAMAAHGVTGLLTDDGDFCTVPGITVFTGNHRVVMAAKAVKALLVR
jgi:predicted nucleic acid-binding protein